MELNPFGTPSLRAFPSLETAYWLLRLRWVAVVGQLLAISFAAIVLQLSLSFTALLVIVGITAATNAGLGVLLAWMKRGKTPWRVSNIATFVIGVHILDLVCLTGLLYCSGGSSNPFLFFFFVNVAVAGIMLRPFWAWFLTGIAILCCLFLLSQPLPVSGITLQVELIEPFWSVRKQGFWIAFATSSCVVTYFVTMLMEELRNREARLAEAEKQHARSARLEAMATLAAGAGHELASPLSTIAVVSKELSRNLEKIEAPSSVKRDVELIRSELDRCREILARMKSSAGEAAAETLDPVSVENVIEAISVGLRDSSRVEFLCQSATRNQMAVLPLEGLALALRNIIQNAIDASSETQKIHVQIEAIGDRWEFEVRDEGEGMDPEILQRIGEPFFTTKEPGQGMGMGVFLSRNVIQRLGGTIRYESEVGRGTICHIAIPVAS